MFGGHTSIEQEIVSMDVIKTKPEVKHELENEKYSDLRYYEKLQLFVCLFLAELCTQAGKEDIYEMFIEIRLNSWGF